MEGIKLLPKAKQHQINKEIRQHKHLIIKEYYDTHKWEVHV